MRARMLDVQGVWRASGWMEMCGGGSGDGPGNLHITRPSNQLLVGSGARSSCRFHPYRREMCVRARAEL